MSVTLTCLSDLISLSTRIETNQRKQIKDLKWAQNQAQMLQELQKAVLQFKEKGPIPVTITKSLTGSKERFRSFLHQLPVLQIKELLYPAANNGQLIDKNRLLKQPNGAIADRLIPSTQYEWHINLSLLMSVYQKTDNEELKKEISFLAINYLAKVAPFSFEEINLNPKMQKKLREMFQEGLFEYSAISYNRESPMFDHFLLNVLQQQFSSASGNLLLITDTNDFKELLPLMFSVIEDSQTEINDQISSRWSQALVDLLRDHFARYADFSFEHPLPKILLFDFTAILEKTIYASNPDHELLLSQLAQIETLINQAIDQASEKFFMDVPEKRQKLKVFLRVHVGCIFRGEIKNVGALKILPIFNQAGDFQCSPILGKSGQDQSLQILRHERLVGDLDHFLCQTGLRLGHVKGRMALCDFIPFNQLLDQAERTLVEYAGIGENIRYFVDKNAFVNTLLFQRLSKQFSQDLSDSPHLQVLSQATIKLIEGFFNELTVEQWEEQHSTSERCQLIQTTLFQMLQHLGKVGNHLNSFVAFTNALELVHNDLAALLALFKPFAITDFEGIYIKSLKIIPESLRASSQAGLGKTAMNIFSGICAAANSLPHPPVIAYGEGAHFEMSDLVGKPCLLHDRLKSEPFQPIDLFFGEFNHNINLDPAHETYQSEDLIAETEEIIAKNPPNHFLTIGIDCTIDLINSAKVQQFLIHFEQSIQSGQLNVILFGSGQKFYLIGMDNYYGSPFCMINNRGSQWEEFNGLKTKKAFETDRLSHQWFCLSNKYAPLDDYRKIIFENAKKILASLPPELIPGNNPLIKVATVSENAETCYIDLKVTNPLLVNRIEEKFYTHFINNGMKIHTRGGYGFFDTNISFFQNTIRIAPGLDPKAVNLITECLNDLSNPASGAS